MHTFDRQVPFNKYRFYIDVFGSTSKVLMNENIVTNKAGSLYAWTLTTSIRLIEPIDYSSHEIRFSSRCLSTAHIMR